MSGGSCDSSGVFPLPTPELADDRAAVDGQDHGRAGIDHGGAILVPRLSALAAIPMKDISSAAKSPTTTILRWVVRSAVYIDQFMASSNPPT